MAVSQKLFIFAAVYVAVSASTLYNLLMTIRDFTHTFLPQLVLEYSQGTLDLHALVDVDLWKRIFPDQTDNSSDERFFWYQVRLNSFELKDSTLLLTYTLPTPMFKDQAKFCGIRVNRQTRQAHYYLLTKPQSIEDQWDILWMPFPKASEKKKLEFLCKIDGTDSLRNFVLTVQHQDFDDASYGTSLLSSFLRHLKDSIVPME